MKVLNMKKLVVTGTVMMMMAGCAQVGEQTKKGAVVGAGTGAVVGAISGGGGSSVLKGAAIGTAVGAAAGYMQDTNK